VADLKEIGLPLAAANAIAGYFGKAVASAVEPEPELLQPEADEPEPDDPEPEPEPPSGPMAEFDEAAVLAWVAAVPGLTAAQRVAALERVAEEEYDGKELAAAKPKRLMKLLKGSEAEGAVPLVLAARDAQLAAEEAAVAAAADAAVVTAVAAAAADAATAARAIAAIEAATAAAVLPPAVAAMPSAEQPACIICLEPYSAVGGVVPRMLRCGHEFCESCLDVMLAPVPPARKRRRRLECPTCRQECAIRSGRASELPTVYGLQGA
jgi:hypothetical protein